jgi:hypothetical protein
MDVGNIYHDPQVMIEEVSKNETQRETWSRPMLFIDK